jgi:hypothetical protein
MTRSWNFPLLDEELYLFKLHITIAPSGAFTNGNARFHIVHFAPNLMKFHEMHTYYKG